MRSPHLLFAMHVAERCIGCHCFHLSPGSAHGLEDYQPVHRCSLASLWLVLGVHFANAERHATMVQRDFWTLKTCPAEPQEAADKCRHVWLVKQLNLDLDVAQLMGFIERGVDIVQSFKPPAAVQYDSLQGSPSLFGVAGAAGIQGRIAFHLSTPCSQFRCACGTKSLHPWGQKLARQQSTYHQARLAGVIQMLLEAAHACDTSRC